MFIWSMARQRDVRVAPAPAARQGGSVMRDRYRRGAVAPDRRPVRPGGRCWRSCRWRSSSSTCVTQGITSLNLGVLHPDAEAGRRTWRRHGERDRRFADRRRDSGRCSPFRSASSAGSTPPSTRERGSHPASASPPTRSTAFRRSSLASSPTASPCCRSGSSRRSPAAWRSGS